MDNNAAGITHVDLIIESRSELAGLQKIRSLFKRYNKIELRINGADAATLAKWEAEINRHYNACGCNEGKFFILLALAAYVLKIWLNDDFYFTWKHAGTGFLYCMAGAAIGKFFGKWLAYLKLRKSIGAMLLKLL